ncbi:type II toxin-antitoxin system CcdA family antitoxin [Acetobacter sp. AN02]|uniref:type II toxin-antitoxin system CcdA family antitoxin n=1 Tax=Acetobacter sp. AN02 TaxID=2894186 RepID=UPI002434446E|nr:type II toxin-antitoxin system CcdA family antitoxin [Acetobacter sp. AN02]MDG6095641.1 type II toxin-antitoxin system CcdA family antitoxin [Acetobacter sp. AN02]
MTAFRTAYDTAAPRRAINLSLNTDLVAQVRSLTPNVSATVEELLASYVDKVRSQRADEERQLDSVLDAVNALHGVHGFLSDEFSTL